MRKLVAVVGALVVLAIQTREASSEETYYKWVDEAGGVHISTDLGDVPEAVREQVEQKVFETPVAPKAAPGAVPSGEEARVTGGPAGGSARPGAATPAGGAQVDKQGRDAAFWQAKAKALRDQKRRLEAEIAQANRKIYSPEIKEQQEGHREKDALARQLKDVAERLDKGLPAEAEAAGADPSWVR